jgi:hypothetical protein
MAMWDTPFHAANQPPTQPHDDDDDDDDNDDDDNDDDDGDDSDGAYINRE